MDIHVRRVAIQRRRSRDECGLAAVGHCDAAWPISRTRMSKLQESQPQLPKCVSARDPLRTVDHQCGDAGQGENRSAEREQEIPLLQGWRFTQDGVVQQGCDGGTEVAVHIGPAHDRCCVFATDIL